MEKNREGGKGCKIIAIWQCWKSFKTRLHITHMRACLLNNFRLAKYTILVQPNLYDENGNGKSARNGGGNSA